MVDDDKSYSSEIDTLINVLHKGDRGEIAQNILKIQTLGDSDKQDFAEECLQHNNLFNSITQYLLSPQPVGDESDPVLMWLADWFQHKHSELRLFATLFIPCVVFTWLSDYQQHKTIPKGTEALLLTIYNKKVKEQDGKDVYWTPPSHPLQNPFITQTTVKPKDKPRSSTISDPSQLTEKMLKQLDKDSSNSKRQLFQQTLLPMQDKQLNNLDRELVAKIALDQFVASMFRMLPSAIAIFCIFVSKYASANFPFEDKNLPSEQQDETKSKKVVMLNPELLAMIGSVSIGRTYFQATTFQTIINGVTYALSTKATRPYGIHSLQALTSRSSYDLLPEVMLSTNALNHILLEEFQSQ